MIRINLLPTARKKTLALPPALIYGAVAAGLVVILMTGLTLFLNSRISSIQENIRAKEGKLKELKVKLTEVKNYEKNNDEVRNKTRIIEQLKKQQVIPLRLLDEASHQLPKGVWLTKMEDKGGRVRIMGYAYTNSDLVTYVQNLKQSKHFSDVMLIESRKDNISDYPVYKFDLTLRMKV